MKHILVALIVLLGCSPQREVPPSAQFNSYAKEEMERVTKAWKDYSDASLQRYKIGIMANNVGDTIYTAMEFTGWDYGCGIVAWSEVKDSPHFKMRKGVQRYIDKLRQRDEWRQDHEYRWATH